MYISASGCIACETEVMSLLDIDAALDIVKRGEVWGKIVLDVWAKSSWLWIPRRQVRIAHIWLHY